MKKSWFRFGLIVAIFFGIACEIPLISKKEDDAPAPGGGGTPKANEPAPPALPALATLAIYDPEAPNEAAYAYPLQNIDEAIDKTLMVSNVGLTDATNLSISGINLPFSYKGGVYPGEGGTCARTLPAQSSCQIVLNFLPTEESAHAVTIQLEYNDGEKFESAYYDVFGQGRDACGKVVVNALNGAVLLGAVMTSSAAFRAQRLNFAATTKIKKVQMILYKSANAVFNSVKLDIRAECAQVGAGLPNIKPCAAASGSATVSSALINTAQELRTFTFTPALTLNAATNYYFSVNPQSLVAGTVTVKIAAGGWIGGLQWYHYSDDIEATWKQDSDIDLLLKAYACD